MRNYLLAMFMLLLVALPAAAQDDPLTDIAILLDYADGHR